MRTTIEAFSDCGPSKCSAGMSIPTRTGRIALSVEIPRVAWDAFLAKWRRGFLTDTVAGLDEDEVIGAIGEIVGNGGESYGTMAPGLASGAGPWQSMLQGLGGQGSPLGALGSQLGGSGGILGGFGQLLGGLGGQGAQGGGLGSLAGLLGGLGGQGAQGGGLGSLAGLLGGLGGQGAQGGGLGSLAGLLGGLGGQGAQGGGLGSLAGLLGGLGGGQARTGTGGGTELEQLLRAAGLPPGTDYSALAAGLGTALGGGAGSLLGPVGTTLGGALGGLLGPLVASLIPTTTRIGRATPEMEQASRQIATLAGSGTLTPEQMRQIGFSYVPMVQLGVPAALQSPAVQAIIARQTGPAMPAVVETGVRPRVSGMEEDLPGLAHGLASTVLGLDDGVESLREVVGATLLEQASRSPLVLEMDDRILPLLRRAIRALDAKAGARSGSEEAVAALDRAYSHPDPAVRSAVRMADSMLGG